MNKYDGESTQSSPGLKRNRFSCRQCRRDKQKCSPADRDWENKFEKCERCMALRHECSQPEKAPGPFARKNSRPALACKSSSIATLPGNLAPTLLYWDASMSETSTYASSDHNSMRINFRYGHGEVSYTPSPDWQNQECTSLSDRARKIIIGLGDLNAAREMLRKELELVGGSCNLVESWLGMPVGQRITINAYIIAIQRKFKVETQKVMNLMMKGLEHDREIIFSALLLIVYRFEHPLDYSSLTNVCIDDQILSQLSLLSSQTRTIFSDADLVCASGLGLPLRYDSTDTAFKQYVQVSGVVSKVLHGVLLEDIEQQSILCGRERTGFPPSHIAYMHGNYNAALALWDRYQVDILRRTLLHLVAYSSDIQMLHRLIEHDGKAVRATIADDFGFTPLAITACCKGEQQFSCFSVLWQSGADRTVLDSKNRSILALAARTGSVRIVSSILQDGNIPKSPRHELLEAVETNLDDTIIRMLMTHYSEYPGYVDSHVLAEANRIALQRGLPMLVQALALSSVWCLGRTLYEKPDSDQTMDFDVSDEWTLLSNDCIPIEPQQIGDSRQANNVHSDIQCPR